VIETIRNAWKIPELRKKILYTILILIVFRIGSQIPVPFMVYENLMNVAEGATLFTYFDMLTGGAFSQATLFAMSISPYITASIIIQLLQVAIPALERLAKEGEAGQKKIAKISRYTTLGLALLQSSAYFLMHRRSGAVQAFDNPFHSVLAALTVIISFTAGAMLIVWLGESIDKNGIGNGISMILFAGIVSRAPSMVNMLFRGMI
jgi:preprotein translocase subunit SecY